MFAQAFRIDSSRFHSRFRTAFEPRKPRHPLLRFAIGAVGLGLLALLVMLGVIVGAAMLAVGMIHKLVRRRGKPIASVHDPRVVDAEYRIVAKPLLPR